MLILGSEDILISAISAKDNICKKSRTSYILTNFILNSALNSKNFTY